jgi:hypothetical protein
MNGGAMKRERRKKDRYSLGELIAALFEETKNVSSDRLEQNVIVYVALKDLLKRRVHTDHPIALQP